MSKLTALLLSLTFVSALAGCNKGTDTMYQLGIVVDGVYCEKSYQPMPTEIDESTILGYVSSYTDTFTEKE